MGFCERTKKDPYNYTQELYKAYNTPVLDNGKKWWIESFLNGTNTPNERTMQRVREIVSETYYKNARKDPLNKPTSKTGYTNPNYEDEEVVYRCCYEPSKHRNISKKIKEYRGETRSSKKTKTLPILPIEIKAPSGTQVDVEKLENGKIRLTFH